METNTLHNTLCITQNLFKNLRLHIAIVRSAWRQSNISKHTSTVSCDLELKNFLKCAVYDIVNGLILIHLPKKVSWPQTLGRHFILCITPSSIAFVQKQWSIAGSAPDTPYTMDSLDSSCASRRNDVTRCDCVGACNDVQARTSPLFSFTAVSMVLRHRTSPTTSGVSPTSVRGGACARRQHPLSSFLHRGCPLSATVPFPWPRRECRTVC